MISGILAGGIPGFRNELCCFSHPPTWPFGVFCVCSVVFLVLGQFQNDTLDVIMHVIPMLVAIPLLFVVFVWVWFWLCVFPVSAVFLWFVLCFWFSCWDCILDCLQVHYQYFCGYRPLTALHVNLNSSFASIERV